jgi:hypothetical protein
MRGWLSSPTHAVAEVKDKISYRGEKFVIVPALIMGMGNIILGTSLAGLIVFL